MKKYLFLIVLVFCGVLFLGKVCFATQYFYYDAESGVVGDYLPNPESGGGPNFWSGWDVSRRGTVQSAGGAAQGAKYFQWQTVDNQLDAYTEINNRSTMPIQIQSGQTYYLAYFFRFDRINGRNIWRSDTDSGDKGIEIYGSGIRWLVGEGHGHWGCSDSNPDHYTVFGGNATYHLNPEIECYDDYPQNRSGYGRDLNAIQLNYETWYSLVMVVKMVADHTGYWAYYINGQLASEYNNIQTVVSVPTTISQITLNGTIAQPSYDSPAHLRKFDALILTDNWQDIVNGGYLGTSDSIAPTVSITAPANGANVSGTSVTVSANASDNVGVVGVQFKLDGANLGAEDTTSPYSIIWNTAQTTNGSHTLTALARDAAGNQTTSGGITVTVNNPIDTQVPSVPINLSALAVSSSQINLSWTASTDNVGVTGYRLERCQGSGCTLTTQIGTSPTNSYSNTGLSPSTTYVYRVAAYDAAGNVSGQSSSASATTQAVDTGPVAWWRFDEGSGSTAADSSGNGNNGTLVNGPVWTMGRIGGALSFDGVNDYMNVPHTSSLSIANTITVSFWMKANNTQADWIRLLSKGGTTGWEFHRDYNGNAINARVDTSGGANQGCYFNVFNGIFDNEWHHIVFILNSGTGMPYKDGVAGTTCSYAHGSGFANTNNLQIGKRNTQDANYFNGLIDDVRVYNRTLSAAEIQVLYNAGNDTTPPAAPTNVTVI